MNAPLNRRSLLALLTIAPAAALLETACGASQATSTASPATPASTKSVPAATSVAAQPTSQAVATGSGGTLVIGMTAGNIPYPDTPPDQGFEGRRFVGYQIYDALTRFNLDQGNTVPTPHPGLAESWQVGADKLTWTFKLRQGVKFHDGTDFNADAFVFQMDRIMNQKSEYFSPILYATNRSNTLPIDTYRAVDPYTVEVKTQGQYSFLPWEMAFILVPSPTAIKKYGNKDYVNHPVGTGPFKVTKYVDGQVMELIPNDQYWNGKPKLDKLILRPMPDPAGRLAALESGGINWAEVPPPDSLDQLKSQGYNILLRTYPHTIILAANLYDPPFNNPQVRVALQYAVDRDHMCSDLLHQVCTPATQYMYKESAWYDPTIGDKFQYDPKKAKQLLAAAGYPNGFTITIAYPTSGSGNMWPQPMMEFLQSNLKDVGVTMKLVPLEWNDIISIYRAGFGAKENQKYNGIYFSVAPIAPSSLLGFASWRIPPKGCCNPMGYQSAQVDKLLLAAQSEFDVTKQNDLLRQAMAVVAQDSPVTFVVHDLDLRVLSPKVQGFVQPMSWFADLNHVFVQK